MSRVRKRLSFRARWALPLLAGPAITAATMAALYVAAGDGGRGDGSRIAYSILNEPVQAATGTGIRDIGNVPPPTDPAEGIRRSVSDAAPPPLKPKDPETYFARVIVVDGASFRAVRDKKPIIIRVAGVTVPAFRDNCTDASGVVWKCGSKGRAELARLIGGRSVACAKLDESDPEAIVGRCRVGIYDIARWLVEQGWADPADQSDPDLVAAAARAKAAGKGRFGPAPFGVIAG